MVPRMVTDLLVLGLFQQWNGSRALAPLPRRAWMGLAVVCGIRSMLFPHPSQDCRRARHRAPLRRYRLVAAFREFAANSGRAIQHPDIAPQPPASGDSRLLRRVMPNRRSRNQCCPGTIGELIGSSASSRECLASRRRSLLVLAVAPV